MAGRISLIVSAVALVVAAVALVVAVSDTVETATSALSDAADLVESLETLPADSLAASGDVSVIVTPAPEEQATEAAEAAVEAPPEDTAATTDPVEATSTETAASLPGAPYEFGPAAGVVLGVVGVEHDDLLNVRDVPFGQVIGALDPMARDVVATGKSRKLPTTVWHEVRVGAVTGWASDAYLAPLGATLDATARIVEILGETPTASTMPELGQIVSEAVASDEPPSRIAVSAGTTIGDLGEITVDVVGLADDSLRGFRLHVFAHVGAGSDPFVLKSVEQTLLCHSHRGVSEEGLCL